MPPAPTAHQAPPADTDAPRGVPRRLLLTLPATATLAGLAAPWLPHHPGAAARPAPERHDDAAWPHLVRRAAFGWLPDGYQPWTYRLTPGAQTISAAVSPGGATDPTDTATLTVTTGSATPPADPPPAQRAAWTAAPPGDRISGAPTQWTALGNGPSAGLIRLRWAPAPTTWAVLEYTAADGADNLTTAHRIAATADPTSPQPVRLPARPPTLPAPLPLQAVDMFDPHPGAHPDDQWTLRLTYATNLPPTNPGLTIDIQHMNPDLQAQRDNPDGGATTRLSGHPARRDTQPLPGDDYQDQVQIWDLDGLKVTITTQGTTTARLLGTDPATLPTHLRLYPNRSTWQ